MASSKAQRDHYAKLARQGCVLCRHLGYSDTDTPIEIHHIRRYGGKRDNAPAVPLCAFHHRHDPHTSIHGLGAKAFRAYWGFDLEDKLLEMES